MVKDKKTGGFDSTYELGAGSVGRRTRMQAASSMASVETSSVSAYADSEAGTEYDEIDILQDDFENDGIPLPSDATLKRRFEKYLNGRESISEENRKHLQDLPPAEKWRVLSETVAPKPSHSASFYVHQLKRHMHPDMHATKKINKKMVKDLTPVPKLLQMLKEDLSNFDVTFLTDFISSPNNGVEVLISFLHDIQLYHNEGIPFISVSSKRAPNSTIPKQFLDTLKRNPKDKSYLLDCLMEIIESSEEGFRLFVDSKKSMETLAQSMMDISIQIRMRAVQIMTVLCSNKNGHSYVLNTMTYVKLKMGESVRFKLLITMLNADPPNRDFQLACLKFLNSLLNSAHNVDERAYLQYELSQLANFDPYAVQESLHGTYDDEISQELELWHSKFIDIQNLHDEYKELENRNKLLRKEVDMLSEKMKILEKEKEQNTTQLTQLQQFNEQYRLKIDILQDKLKSNLKRQDSNAQQPSTEENENVYDETVAVDQNQTENGVSYEEVSTEEGNIDVSATGPIPSPPPAPPMAPYLATIGVSSLPVPPPPPPPPSSSFLANEKNKRVIKPNVTLPMLNWIPMSSASSTIFKEVDDENVFKEIDFMDFETRFKMKQRSESSDGVADRLERARKRLEEQVTVIEKNRAKNLIITKRRISTMTDKQIKEAISTCDIGENGVPSEIAELLLKFLPTREELRGLAKNADKYDMMGDAEKFMFKMARIDRYEYRLKLMAFMGIYEDLISTVSPQIEGVLKASASVIEAKKLRKLLEVVLAFGNYMNGSRRGPAYGFRLESFSRISDTKNTERTYSLLHYIAKTILERFPDVADWYQDLEVEGALGVSLESVSTDIHGLRKGMEITRFEKEKQEENTIIADFYARASENVYKVSEQFAEMQQKYTEVCILFGENSKSIDPGEFFKYVADFIADFKKAVEDLECKDLGFDETIPTTIPRTSSSLSYKEPTSKDNLDVVINKENHSPPSSMTTPVINVHPTPKRMAPRQPDSNAQSGSTEKATARLMSEEETKEMITADILGAITGKTSGYGLPRSKWRQSYENATAAKPPATPVEDDADSGVGIQEQTSPVIKKPLKSALKKPRAGIQNGILKNATKEPPYTSHHKDDSKLFQEEDGNPYDMYIPSPTTFPGKADGSDITYNPLYSPDDIEITHL